MARYFIGLMAPPAVQAQLADFTAAIQASLPAAHDSKVSWTAPEDLHCTLLFVGHIDDEQHLAHEMHRVASQLESITVTIHGKTHWLGRNSLVLAVTGAEQAGTTFVEELGHLSSDRWTGRRPFYGHVSLGRVRPVPTKGNDIFAGHAVEPITWVADRVHLVKSRDGHASSRYQSIAQARFGG